MARHVIGAARDLLPGGRLVVVVAGRKLVVFNLGGTFHGLDARCPHQGGDLSRGRTSGLVAAGAAPGAYVYTRAGEILRCPWHGWEYDIRTGRSTCRPERVRAVAYPVEVAPPELRADTVAVDEIDGSLVVEL